MTEELSTCPICNKTKFILFSSIKDHFLSKETFHVMQCTACGFRFLNPRPDAADISYYYQSKDYISHDASKKDLISHIYKLARNISIRNKYNLVRQYCETGAILDFGCGTGEFLAYCKKMKHQVVGVELNNKARDFAINQQKIEVFNDINTYELNLRTFDCITMWHVLEHVHDLSQTLKRINSLLSNSGILIIAVPNCNSPDARKYKTFWAAYDVPRHLYHFTTESFTRLAHRHHFIIENILPQKLDAYYVSMLSEKYQNGKNNYFRSFLNGLRSNFLAKRDNMGYSSQIFVLNRVIR
ncbi:MAG: class I SAM-dependent methyltransferase [Bacteroidetes bacterium]|nr:class I SAM-dependent methyltransferase [Bacteroidota bacterium]